MDADFKPQEHWCMETVVLANLKGQWLCTLKQDIRVSQDPPCVGMFLVLATGKVNILFYLALQCLILSVI